MKPEGYLKGRPQSLFVLDYGLFRVHSGPRDIGIMGFLIRTDAGENILVDTGFPQKYADDVARASREDRLHTFGEVLICSQDNMPARQLALAGVSLERIDLMIQTHTHIDHVGHIAACPQAPIIIAEAERSLPKPLYWGELQPLDWPDRTYVLVDRDVQIGPGFDVLFTPGHAPGQLALKLMLPETGPVLLASDAISRPAEVAEGFAGSWNQALAIEQGARLMEMAEAEGATLIYGHCPDQWARLRKAPASYG